mgnify:CR=1 FL=1
MKKNKKLYKWIVVLVVLLCTCFIISFALKKNNQNIRDNTEIIDIDNEEEIEETEKELTNDNTNKDEKNNGTGNNTNEESSYGTKPVIVDGEGDTVVKSDDGDKILPTENENIDDTLEGGALSVNDNDKTWSNNTEIHIFNVSQIAPGDGSTYEFIVNNNTQGNVKYSITFNEKNVVNVNMLYKLKRNDEYIAGDETTWVKYNELNLTDRILNQYTMDTYNIEWKWIDAENDTAVGRTKGAKYGLNVKVDAFSTTEYDRYSNATLNPDTGDKIIHYIEIALLSLIALILLIIKRRQKA